MCGIVGGIANKNIVPLLLQGLSHLEYRGYDSSGLIVLSRDDKFIRARSIGKVQILKKRLNSRINKIKGNIGIAHVRWATHGEPSNHNAHPHVSKNTVSVVHNGIIENYRELKKHFRASVTPGSHENNFVSITFANNLDTWINRIFVPPENICVLVKRPKHVGYVTK